MPGGLSLNGDALGRGGGDCEAEFALVVVLEFAVACLSFFSPKGVASKAIDLLLKDLSVEPKPPPPEEEEGLGELTDSDPV